MASILGRAKARYDRRLPLARRAALLLAAAPWCLGDAGAEEHIVHTRRTEWIPTVLFVQPGDSVVFRGMHGHETALVDGMGPPGVPPWRSELDAEGFRITLTELGAYIYTCDIHINGGMVGAIVVGDGRPSNLAAIDAAVQRVDIGRIFVERVIGRMKRALERRD